MSKRLNEWMSWNDLLKFQGRLVGTLCITCVHSTECVRLFSAVLLLLLLLLLLLFFSITHSNTIGRFLRQKKTWFHAEFARTTDVMVNTIMYGKLTVRVWHRVVKYKILCSETTPGQIPSFTMIQDFTQGVFHKNCKPLPSITSSHDLIATSIDDSNVETPGMEGKLDNYCRSFHLYRNYSLDVLSTTT